MGIGIGEAVETLKRGLAVRRSGWSKSGMWLALVVNPSASLPFMAPVSMVEHFVVVKTVVGELVPWSCGQTDLLASDWEVVPEGERGV